MKKKNKVINVFVLAAFVIMMFFMVAGPSVTKIHASEPFIAEIKMFAGNFAPRGYALCDGQLLSISSNDALFSLVGTTYGGDGRTTFGLPDLRGRLPMHQGSGPGLSPRSLGESGGTETVALTEAQMPNHNHQATVNAYATEGDQAIPDGGVWAKSGIGDPDYHSGTHDATMKADAVTIGNAGSGQSHANMPPFQAVSFIIALQGIYPSR